MKDWIMSAFSTQKEYFKKETVHEPKDIFSVSCVLAEEGSPLLEWNKVSFTLVPIADMLDENHNTKIASELASHVTKCKTAVASSPYLCYLLCKAIVGMKDKSERPDRVVLVDMFQTTGASQSKLRKWNSKMVSLIHNVEQLITFRNLELHRLSMDPKEQWKIDPHQHMETWYTYIQESDVNENAVEFMNTEISVRDTLLQRKCHVGRWLPVNEDFNECEW